MLQRKKHNLRVGRIFSSLTKIFFPFFDEKPRILTSMNFFYKLGIENLKAKQKVLEDRLQISIPISAQVFG